MCLFCTPFCLLCFSLCYGWLSPSGVLFILPQPIFISAASSRHQCVASRRGAILHCSYCIVRTVQYSATGVCHTRSAWAATEYWCHDTPLVDHAECWLMARTHSNYLGSLKWALCRCQLSCGSRSQLPESVPRVSATLPVARNP